MKFICLATLIDQYLYEKNINIEENPLHSYCDFYALVQIEKNFKDLLF